MEGRVRGIRRWPFSVVFTVIVLGLLRTGEAALCIFRNPDRDVYRLFPDATGYRSVIINVDKEKERLKKLEGFLGTKLDYDEHGEHTFYEILKGENVIGIIRPHAERGRYGIIEIVWALSLDGKIRDYLIQRSRERKTMDLKSEKFRKQFKGKSLGDPFTVGKSKKLNPELITFVPKGGEKGASAIAFSAKKNLAIYKYFLSGRIKMNPIGLK